MPVLAVDSSSPTVSVALATTPQEVLASRTCPQRGSSALLIEMIDATLAEARLTLRQLDGIVALAGPGSFTGLRVGLATVLGLHQASGVAATAVPTLQVMAAACPTDHRTVAALVDALRGEWFAQTFRRGATAWPQATSEPSIQPAEALAQRSADSWVCWGDGPAELEGRCREPVSPLAEVAARLAVESPPDWSAEALEHPLYLRAAPVRSSARSRRQ